VKGGNLVTATVSISYPACAQGLSVSLLSANPSVASVPPSVTVERTEICDLRHQHISFDDNYDR
jgi:hypothetical protein